MHMQRAGTTAAHSSTLTYAALFQYVESEPMCIETYACDLTSDAETSSM